MNKHDIFKKFALQLWDEDVIDKNNYNFNYGEFEEDFLKYCNNFFNDFCFITGKILT